MKERNRILMILGGIFHDFEGFSNWITPVFSEQGYELTKAYDLDELLTLPHGAYDLVVSYTSLSKHREGENDTHPETLTDAQTEALTQWVEAGGAVLLVHAATVSGKANPRMKALYGGVFVSHPPQFSFTVYPFSREHAVTTGVDAFSVFDEFYVQEYEPSVEIHMAAEDRGVMHPMVWSQQVEKGRVVHIAMGHSERVWLLPQYRKLIAQAVQWLLSITGSDR